MIDPEEFNALRLIREGGRAAGDDDVIPRLVGGVHYWHSVASKARRENTELRATIEHARMENLRVALELGRVNAAVESDLSDADARTRIRTLLAEVRPLDAFDFRPEPRRVELTELANELAGLIQDTTDDFVPLNARYGLADAFLSKFDVTPKVETARAIEYHPSRIHIADEGES